jgi:hypothetical protein
MNLIDPRRIWTPLLVVCVPTALGVIAWSAFFGGRAVSGALAACYLLVLVAGRAHAADQARRATPARLERVRGQLDRVRSTLPLEQAR